VNYARYRKFGWSLTLLNSAINSFNNSLDVQLLYPPKAPRGSRNAAVGERAIAHRLAVHLGDQIRSLRNTGLQKIAVDCEYNRHLHAVKALDVENALKHVVTEANRALRRSPVRRRWYRFRFAPDVVVHERAIDEGNLLAIELKRQSNNVVAERKYDDLKLRLLTRPRDYGYDYVLGAGVTAVDSGIVVGRELKIRVLYFRGHRVRER
jgi:hypothetical protein